MSADVVHVVGCRVLDGAPSGGQKADQDAAGIFGVRFSDDQAQRLHSPKLMRESTLLPLQQPAQFLSGHTARRVLGEYGKDLIVGPGDSGVLKQVPVQAYRELMASVREGPPGPVFAGVEPLGFFRHSDMLSLG